MNITNEMLQAATKKAIEAGLLPRNACRENLPAHQELIRFILKAALEVAPAARGVSWQLAPRERAAGHVRRAANGRSADVQDLAMRVTEYALR